MKRDRADDIIREKVLLAQGDDTIDANALWNRLQPMMPAEQKKAIPFYYKAAAAIVIIAAGIMAMQYINAKSDNNEVAANNTVPVQPAVKQEPAVNVVRPMDTKSVAIEPGKVHPKRHKTAVPTALPHSLLAADETDTRDPSTLGLYASIDDEQDDDDTESEQLLTY